MLFLKISAIFLAILTNPELLLANFNNFCATKTKQITYIHDCCIYI